MKNSYDLFGSFGRLLNDQGYDLRNLQLYARFDGATGEGITNAYNGFGRQSSSTLAMDGVTRELAYRNREDGLRTRLTHPDGMAFTYGHDAAGRASGVYYGLDTNIPLALWSYDARGLLLSRLEGGGAGVAYGHDEIGRLASLADTFTGGTGNVTATFAYNPASQVVRRTRDNDAYAAAPPAAARSYAVNRLNQYTAVGGVAHSYDLNGNLTSDGTRTYTYDIENRLVGSGSVGLRYDPLGRLYELSGGSGGTRRFLWDGDALVSEHDAAGALAARYVHGSAAGADDPLIWYDGLAVRWLHADHQGSIAAVTNGNGTLHAINAYDEWGVPNAGNVGRFGYTGQIWLPELGLWHYKGRAYSPRDGRFMQVDPIGYEDQLNLYAYVGNDPVNGADPTGLARNCQPNEENCIETPESEQQPGDPEPPSPEEENVEEIVVTARRPQIDYTEDNEEYFEITNGEMLPRTMRWRTVTCSDGSEVRTGRRGRITQGANAAHSHGNQLAQHPGPADDNAAIRSQGGVAGLMTSNRSFTIRAFPNGTFRTRLTEGPSLSTEERGDLVRNMQNWEDRPAPGSGRSRRTRPCR